MLLELYYFLLNSSNNNNIIDEIIDLIKNKKIQMEEDDKYINEENKKRRARNSEYSKINKLSFLYIVESLSIIFKRKLGEDIANYKNLKNDFINSIKYNIQNLLKLDKIFFLFSKEISNLNILNKLITKIQSKSNDKEFAIKSLESLKSIYSDINNEKNDIIKIKNQNKAIFEIFKQNLDEYGIIENKILLNHYKLNQSLEQGIIKDLLFDNQSKYNNKLIEYSYPLIKHIFQIKKIFKVSTIFKVNKNKGDKEKLDFMRNSLEVKEQINKENNSIINEMFLYRFEILCNKYFKKIGKQINKISDINKLCGNISKTYLEKAINQYYKLENGIVELKKIDNILNIYCISFIKIYLNYYIDILLDNEKYENFSERVKINEILFSNKVNQVETIKLYTLKLIFKKCKNNWKKFETYFNRNNNDKFGFNEYDCFKKTKFDNDESFQLIPILLLDNINKENNEYNELLTKKELNEDNKKIFEKLFVQDELNIEYIYSFISNLLILYYCTKNEFKDKNNYIPFIANINKYLNKKENKLNKIIIEFIKSIFKESKILSKIGINDKTNEKDKLKKISILLFSQRYILSIIINKDNDKSNFYYDLLTKKILDILGNQFISKYLNIKFDEKNEDYLEFEDYKIENIFLQFIIFSFLFYSNIQGLLKDNDFKKYVNDSNNCFERMENNWDILQEKLNSYNIDIRIFLNISFVEIIKKLKDCQTLNNKEEVLKFLKQIKEIIDKIIKNINLIDDYNNQNNYLININQNLTKTIIQEVFPANKYSENEYPDLKYFYISELPSKENFIEKFKLKKENQVKYPILNIIVTEDDFNKKLHLLKYLPTINRLCNYMINYVSHKYSREEAKNKTINGEKFDENIINLIKEFIEIYKIIRPFIKNEEDNQESELDFKELDDNFDNLHLYDLCIDSNEIGYGFVLFNMYKEMAKWQNSFIDKVLSSQNENIIIYKDNFNEDINISIQNCENSQILNLPTFDKGQKDIYDNIENFRLMKKIKKYSIRKENKIIYNFEEIENKLASFILQKIKKFNLEEFNTVNYKGECNIKDINNSFNKFIKMYHQEKLENNELMIVYNYIKGNKNFDFKNFLFYKQFLIYDILENSPDINEKISNIMGNKKIGNIEIFKNFFKSIEENLENEDKKNNLFTIKKLINLFDFIELLYWDSLNDKIEPDYSEEIEEDIKMKLKEYFDENNKEAKDINNILKIDFCSALRKFIIRYILVKAYENEKINPKNNLKNYLLNIELWKSNKLDKEEKSNLEKNINKILEIGDIKISQAFQLYQFLGGDKSILSKIKEDLNIKEEKHQNEDRTMENNNKDEPIVNAPIIDDYSIYNSNEVYENINDDDVDYYNENEEEEDN